MANGSAGWKERCARCEKPSAQVRNGKSAHCNRCANTIKKVAEREHRAALRVKPEERPVADCFEAANQP